MQRSTEGQTPVPPTSQEETHYKLQQGPQQGSFFCYDTQVTQTQHIMKGIQLTPQLRYVPLSDEKGDFGLVIYHQFNQLIQTFEVHSRDELVSLVERFT